MFKGMKMQTKIVAGFFLVIALLVVVSVLSILALREASDGFAEYRGLARDTNLAGRLQANMLMVRMNVKDFIITGSEEDVGQYNEYWEKMTTFMAEAQQDIQNPERATMVDSADEKVKTYNVGFEKVVGYMAQRDRLVKEVLDVHGPVMENKLTEILESADADEDMTAAFHSSLALKHLLLLRLYMAKFLDANLQAYVDRVHAEYDKMSEQLSTLDRELQNPGRRELLGEIMERTGDYIKAFDEMAATIFERNGVIDGTLDKLGPEIAAHVEDVKLSVKTDQDELGPMLQASNSQAISMVLIIGIVALIVGVFMAFFITANVLRQLGSDPAVIAGVADQIAGGDLVIEFAEGKKGVIGVYGSMKDMAESLTSIVDQVRGGGRRT